MVPVKPRDLHLLALMRLVSDREPAVVVTVNLRREESERGSRVRPPVASNEIGEEATVRIGQLVFKEVAASILQQLSCVIGIPASDSVRLITESGPGVVAKPEHETIERRFEKVVVIQKLLQLLVFDAVRWIAADHAISEKDSDRRAFLDRTEQVEITLGQLELDAVDCETPVPNAPRWFKFTLR